MKTGVMIGDSHSQLVFPLLSDKLSLRFEEIISKPGWGVKKFMSEGIPQNLPEADVCIVALGGNNMDMNEASYMASVQQFLDVLKTKYKRIVWIGPYYSTDGGVNRRHYFTNLFLKLHLPISIGYIETYKLGRDIPHRDGVHYRLDGYKALIQLFFKRLNRLVFGIAPRVWLSHPKVGIPFTSAIVSFALLVGIDIVGGESGQQRKDLR